MKVRTIDFYSQNRVNVNNINSSKEKAGTFVTTPLDASPIGCFSQFSISFKSKSREAPHYEINLNELEVKNLPCPCCGRIMIPRREFDREFEEEFLPTNGAKLLKRLQPYEDKMYPVEKQVFIKLKQMCPQPETASLQNIIDKLYNENLSDLKIDQALLLKTSLHDFTAAQNNKIELSKERAQILCSSLQELVVMLYNNSIIELKKHQNEVLDKIEALCSGLTLYESNKVQSLIQSSRYKIDEISDPFKRKKFIEKIENTKNYINPNISRKMHNEALKLNNSHNDGNAFIVKYSRRTSKEICRRLLLPSLSTIEHIHPHCDFDDKYDADKMTNIFLECKECNEEKANKLLPEQIKKHPEMPHNTQRHFDIFIEKMKSGEISKSYKPEMLAGVAKTLEIESNGLIKINLSKMESLLAHGLL